MDIRILSLKSWKLYELVWLFTFSLTAVALRQHRTKVCDIARNMVK